MARTSKDYLYIATSRDKYELPIAVADSAKELAEMLGMEVRTVYMYLSPSFQKDPNRHSGFYKVYVGDLED